MESGMRATDAFSCMSLHCALFFVSCCHAWIERERGGRTEERKRARERRMSMFVEMPTKLSARIARYYMSSLPMLCTCFLHMHVTRGISTSAYGASVASAHFLTCFFCRRNTQRGKAHPHAFHDAVLALHNDRLTAHASRAVLLSMHMHDYDVCLLSLHRQVFFPERVQLRQRHQARFWKTN